MTSHDANPLCSEDVSNGAGRMGLGGLRDTQSLISWGNIGGGLEVS